MVKQGFLLIAFSVIAIFFRTQLEHVLHWLLMVHNRIVEWLMVIFSGNPVAQIIMEVMALLVIPVVLGLIVLLVYFAIKRKMLEDTMSVVWIVWTVLLVTIIAQGT